LSKRRFIGLTGGRIDVRMAWDVTHRETAAFSLEDAAVERVFLNQAYCKKKVRPLQPLVPVQTVAKCSFQSKTADGRLLVQIEEGVHHGRCCFIDDTKGLVLDMNSKLNILIEGDGKNLRAFLQPEPKELITCRYCGVKVLAKRLAKHELKVHGKYGS
jgi:DNA-directed RNA polymerase subunit RPC12/RpoP